ncbi:MAG TPA: alkaline phosphatase family protein [Streptosporangiaceae bacterium]|nr:alkaline phosphatase family protein [Streptosporangiaceae bacterium]
MTRQKWSWSSARRLFRLPAWAAVVAVAFVVGAVVVPMAAHAGLASDSSRGDPPEGPALKHVFVIMMENTSYNDLLSPSNQNTTFIQQLAADNGLATDYFGVTHDSLPNYIATTSGQTWGTNSDDVNQAPLFNHENLVDQLEAAGVSWKAYMEDLPSPGNTLTQTSDGLYVRKHDPFLLYPDVYQNPARADKVVPLTQLSTDLSTGNVPQFVWITPNSCNDMHGGATGCPFANAPNDANQQALYKDGDTFLRTWVGLITHSRAWTRHSAIFITWDEGGFEDAPPFGPTDITPGPDSPILPATPANPSTGGGGDLAGGTVYGGGHVPMIVVARGVGHRVDPTFADHYSLLQTIEQNYGLPLLGNAGDLVQVGDLRSLYR